MKFIIKKPHYEYLRNKWVNRHKSSQDKLWTKHKDALKQIAMGSLSGILLLTPPNLPVSSVTHLAQSRDDALEGYDYNVLLAEQINRDIPKEVRLLEPNEELKIIQILSQSFGFKVSAEVDGIRLPRNYGLIGGEQHLYRYPGDNLYAHAENSVDYAKYGGAGIAPGLGAWGYFASSKEEFKEINKQRERFYLAIQTFLVSGYAENVVKFRGFFKFRKMLVVNPKTGQAVVAIIGDAGPADWTGKHLGGSPEVMDMLSLAKGSRKGSVLYFFIDDPKDKIPLGPIKVKNQV